MSLPLSVAQKCPSEEEQVVEQRPLKKAAQIGGPPEEVMT